MDSFKRFGPLVGGVILAAAVILRAFGYQDVAGVLEFVSSAFGVPADVVAELMKVPAAVVVIVGVVRKFIAMYRQSKAEQK